MTLGSERKASVRWRTVISPRSTWASRAWMTWVTPEREKPRPSANARAAAMSGATTSMTFSRSASSAVAEMLSRTAFSAQSALRPRVVAMLRAKAAVSFSTFRAMSLPACFSTSSPPPATGWAAPMTEVGCMAATSAASVMNTPADPARAPPGPTQTTTGTSLASMRWTMSRVASRCPPGVSSAMATAAYPSSFARESPASTYSAVPVVMGAFTSRRRTRGRAGSAAAPVRRAPIAPAEARAATSARRVARPRGQEPVTFPSRARPSRTPS